ncbi:MAG: ferrous iron transporter B [Ruminococcus sp.]|nr:ferrous iron transporter B [Ruminococcus sp.]
MENNFVIVLAGNPNVGKSTVFNALTGLKQHTGNWAGKTVACAEGNFEYNSKNFTLADIAGIYSLFANSAEEQSAYDFICSGKADGAVVVCDASCLERNLNLALQIIQIIPKTVICINLIDEAEKKGIYVDSAKLSDILGVPVVLTSARNNIGLDSLCDAICDVMEKEVSPLKIDIPESREDAIAVISAKSGEIANQVTEYRTNEPYRKDRLLDKIFMSRKTGIPVMLVLFGLIMWITVTGANYPSQLLSRGLFAFGDILSKCMLESGLPSWIEGVLIQGIYKVLAWVVSVMLPPMAIFFPLFTILEDSGYLPRIAFNLDGFFRCSGACGKQAITMSMGLGCNACGVTGCRIIDSPRERLIAILTNSFTICNGRFPTIISVITMFLVTMGGIMSSVLSGALLLGVILLGVGATLAVSFLLSRTLLKGESSSYTLELPPYRKPQFVKVLVRSLLDRTIFVLGRACTASIPCGLILWVLANISLNNVSLLHHISQFLAPLGNAMGLDGTILMAFILGFPANEIVVPIILMTYMSQGSLIEMSNNTELWAVLVANGWSIKTAVCMIIFTVFHFPCATTCMTIRKETGSMKWTLISFALPTAIGVFLCILINTFA